MGNSLQINNPNPVPLRRSAYLSVRMALRLRYNVPKVYKPIFDMEANHTYWDAPIEMRARLAEVSVEEYRAALKNFEEHPAIMLAIALLRVENDFLHNWWKNLKDCEAKARQMLEDPEDKLNGIKALLMVEREKQMGVKRLVETGRMIDPDKYARNPQKTKPKPARAIVDEKGVVDIEKIG